MIIIGEVVHYREKIKWFKEITECITNQRGVINETGGALCMSW